MVLRRPEGAALLVAGFGAAGAPASDGSAMHTLAQIGEALLATGAAWQIRRLTAATGERYAADRATLKQHLDELAIEPVRSAIVVLLGAVVQVGGAPALVTGTQAREYPEDATLPLAWIRERLLAAKAEQLVVVMSARGEGSAGGWLGVLGTYRTQHVIAVDAPAEGHPVIDALLTGLCGDALDPRTGTVTMASLSEYVAHHVPLAMLQPSTASETLAQPPPLAGFWDVRRSQLAHRAQRPRAPDELEDLTRTVLPGQFRIDGLLARGTFGTVYRARQLAVERDVAVKVLHADIDPSSEDGRLFVQEIRSIGQIDHTNVVRIYQADITHDGRLFFAMELLNGRDLQELGGAGVLPRARAVELVHQLLSGLGAAHDAGLVHADVKPANAIVVPLGRGPVRSTNGGGSGRVAVAEAAAAGATGATGAAAEATAADLEGAGDDGERGERLVLVDFGLARLRAPDRPTASAGGTPAYMAPEQLHEGRVDARSDLYSAALVLVFLLTGRRRSSINELVPSFDDLDPDLRAVLERALDPDPAKRFQTARALIAALTGRATASVPVAPLTPIVPFRHLAPFTETDLGRLHGREADVALLTEHVLFRRCVIYTAPSGTGKTSMLRAGLVPRLEALGIRAIYQPCRGKPISAIASAIDPGGAAATGASRGGEDSAAPTHEASRPADPASEASPVGGDPAGFARGAGRSPVGSIADAIASWRKQHDRKLVLVLDQIESALGDPDLLPAVLAFDRWPAGADVSVVLSVREDHLARLVGRTQELEPGAPIVRLPPLGLEGARAAISGPLAECRLAIEPELLDALLEDLQRAAAALGPEMGWGGAAAVYPPHLQLACSVLFEHLGPGDATLTLAHYRSLGGFDAIVGEHLERVLDTELADGRDVIARDLFVALVTASHERAVRPESELLAMVGAKHGAAEVTAVLEILRSRGLLVRVRGAHEPAWELVHDSLVPRVLAWLDARDLARRRAIELVRHHLRRSRPGEPSLLDRAELRELDAHPGVVEELEEEWRHRGADGEWTPERLVARSRQVLRRRRALRGLTILAALAIGVAGAVISYQQWQHASAERERALGNIGEVELVIEAFDWDAKAQRATPAPTPEDWRWELHDRTDPEAERPFREELITRSTPKRTGVAVAEAVDVRGGPASLTVQRPGCAPSIVPLKLPGYSPHHVRSEVRLRIPTCAASSEGMARIPRGEFIYGGVGVPPSPKALELAPDDKLRVEQQPHEPEFSIDRTEVTNAAFAVFSAMSAVTGIAHPQYPNSPELGDSRGPRHPVSYLSWSDARSYCRFLGKDLPTTRQWVKALRGGLKLPDGTQNPEPRRNLPWIAWRTPIPARVMIDKDTAAKGTAEVGSYPEDVSPYEVHDLAGNVEEWTLAELGSGAHVVRGGEWGVTNEAVILNLMALDNLRPDGTRTYALGVRCASR